MSLKESSEIERRGYLLRECSPFLALSTSSASEFRYEILSKDRERSFFAVTDDYFGLAFGHAQRGDQIVLNSRLDVHLILTKTPQGHALVSYGYVHGIMWE